MLGKKRRKFRKNRSARRARKRGLPWEDYHWDDVVKRDGTVCYLCETEFDPELDHGLPWSPSVDHVIPLDDPHCPGDLFSNVKIVHEICNSRKGNLSVEDLKLPFERPEFQARPKTDPSSKPIPESDEVRYDLFVWED